MRRIPVFLAVGLLAAQFACDDDPVKSKMPEVPPPAAQGVQAFLQVDNERAQPGEHVRVYVRVQLGTENQAKIGSYAGRLRFDPAALGWVRDAEVNDGLRVTNPNDAASGDIRFAGAAANGFNDLSLYQGEFEVKKTGYMDALKFDLDELSAALTLGNLQPQLQMVPQVFLRVGAP